MKAAQEPEPAPVTNPATVLDGWRLALTLPCILTGLLLATMDGPIVSTALVTIGNDFNDFINTIWIVLGYLLAYMTFSLFWPRVSGLIGRKWAFIIASIALFAFSLDCGLARTLNELIAFRVLQGFGGLGLYSLGCMVLPEISPIRWYSFMLAGQGTILTLSGVLGPLLGGIIATRTSWRWIFYLNLPICAVIAIVLMFSWKDDQRTGTFRQHLDVARRFDFLGLVLFSAATCCLVLGMEIGGASLAPWVSPQVLVLLCGAVVLAFVFFIWNAYCQLSRSKAHDVLFPFSLFRIRLVTAAILVATLAGHNLLLAVVNIPLRFQVVNASTALIAGVRFTPFLIASADGSTTSGLICARRNWTFPALMVSGCLLLIGCSLIMSLNYGFAIQHTIYGYQVLWGLGMGGTLSASGMIIGINVNYADYGVSSGIVNQVRVFGGCLGLTISNIILNQTFTSDLRLKLTADELQSLLQSLEYTNNLKPEQQWAVSQAFAKAFSRQCLLATCVAVVGILVSLTCWTRHPIDLKRRLEVGARIGKLEITAQEADAILRGSNGMEMDDVAP